MVGGGWRVVGGGWWVAGCACWMVGVLDGGWVAWVSLDFSFDKLGLVQLNQTSSNGREALIPVCARGLPFERWDSFADNPLLGLLRYVYMLVGKSSKAKEKQRFPQSPKGGGGGAANIPQFMFKWQINLPPRSYPIKWFAAPIDQGVDESWAPTTNITPHPPSPPATSRG